MFYVSLEPADESKNLKAADDLIWITFSKKKRLDHKGLNILIRTEDKYNEFVAILKKLCERNYYNHYLVPKAQYPMLKQFMITVLTDRDAALFKYYFKIETPIDKRKRELRTKHRNMKIVINRKARVVIPGVSKWMYVENDELKELTDEQIMNGHFVSSK